MNKSQAHIQNELEAHTEDSANSIESPALQTLQILFKALRGSLTSAKMRQEYIHLAVSEYGLQHSKNSRKSVTTHGTLRLAKEKLKPHIAFCVRLLEYKGVS